MLSWSEVRKVLTEKIISKFGKGITPEYLQILYKSIPRHMKAVIAAEGGHTKSLL